MPGKPDYTIEITKPLLEKCGIVGISTPRYERLTEIAIQAASGVQHRGQHGAGYVLQTQSGMKSFKQDGLLKTIFTPQVIRQLDMPQIWSMVHCRYGTNGDYSDTNIQPCIANTNDGRHVAVVHNGEFVDVEGLKRKTEIQFDEGASDTYIFTRMLAEMEGDWDQRILKVLSFVKGAYSLMIGVGDDLYVCRDAHGMRPLFIGEIDDIKMIASETYALDKAGATFLREVSCGELIRFRKGEMTVITTNPDAKRHFCDFEWSYFARPDSRFSRQLNGTPETNEENLLSVHAFRERCGEIIADESPISHADFVVGVPDSGLAIGCGYAGAMGLPLKQLIIRDHFDSNGAQRLFMRDDDRTAIGSKVLGKLSIIPDRFLWRDKVVVLCDDSIVRGNVSEQITRAVYSLGAKEVHWVIGFPQVRHKCHLGVSIRSHEELIAAKHQGDPVRIAAEIGATSVNYISNIGLLKARIKNGQIAKVTDADDIFLANGGCGGCITGKYPVTRTGMEYAYET
jgi:amidophosphoribosyltransferase